MSRLKTFDENEILQKALKVFWKKGYSGTSIQDLVDNLGINRASLYNTYGDKLQLFTRAFEEYRNNRITVLKTFLDSQSDVKKGIKGLFEMAITEATIDADRKGCLMVNTTTEFIPGNPEILQVLEKNKKVFERLFYQFLKKGEASGQIEKGKDLKSISSFLFMMYNGLTVVAKIDPSRSRLNKSIDIALKLLD